MEVYHTVLMDGTKATYTFLKSGTRHIYKQRKKTLQCWLAQLKKSMLKAKYPEEEILHVATHAVWYRT